MKLVPIVLAALVVPVGVADAQQAPRNTVVRSDKTMPIQVRPGVNVPLKPLIIRQRRQIYDVPDIFLTLGRDAWTAPSRAIAARYPRSAVAVERFRNAGPVPCKALVDRLYVSPVRESGLMLVGYSAEPLKPPPGYSLYVPLEAIATTLSAPDTLIPALSEADYIRIRPPVFVKRTGIFHTCWAGYRLSITVDGPLATDPFVKPSYQRPRRPERNR